MKNRGAPKRGRGRPRKTTAEKLSAGTLRPSREAAYEERARATANADVVGMRIDPDPEPKQDFIAVMRGYMNGVRDGSIIAGQWVKLAVERQLRDEARSGSSVFAWSPFFAIKACAFLEQLPHVEGRWDSPLVRLEPWQVFVVCCFFGWRYRSDSLRRRFTTLYLETGKKTAKSTLMAGFALYHLTREEEPGAQVVCGATTGTQARIVFNIALRMVQRSAWLRREGAIGMANSIRFLDGVMKPINARASSQDGLNPSCIVLDESHGQSPELADVLRSAQGARRNPMLLCPTTAGSNLLSVGYAMHQAIKKILTNVVHADHQLGLIYAIDDGDDWRDEKCWYKAMPMLGITPDLDETRRYFADVLATPSMEAEFQIKRLSVWRGAGTSFLSLPKWDACADPSCRFEKFLGRECCIGIDLSQSDDLTAVAYSFLIDDLLWSCVDLYLPEDVVEERARKIPELLYWVKLGILNLTPGSMIDHNRVEADLRAKCQRVKVRDIAADQFASLQMIGSLFNSGLPARIESKNAHTVTPSALELEKRVKAAKFRHDGNPALRWQASNVVVTRKMDKSLLPKKDHAESPNKIDAIDAILRSISGWLRGGSVVQQRQYQTLMLR